MLVSLCPDSGYLFSGSRPPSRVSRPQEVPLSGKESESPEESWGHQVEAGRRAGGARRAVLRHGLRGHMDLPRRQRPVPRFPLGWRGRARDIVPLAASLSLPRTTSFAVVAAHLHVSLSSPSCHPPCRLLLSAVGAPPIVPSPVPSALRGQLSGLQLQLPAPPPAPHQPRPAQPEGPEAAAVPHDTRGAARHPQQLGGALTAQWRPLHP